MRRPTWLLFTGLAMVAASAAVPAPGQAQAAAPVTPQQVEAAYLYKFGGYVTWPDNAFAAPDSPIVIGVAGADDLADDLSGLVSGRSIGSRPVQVRRLHDGLPADVHILFISNPGSEEARQLFESARGRPVLVVTEGEKGLALGGAVSFVVVDERVRFDVSLDAVQRNGLKLSSLLLSVAHTVTGDKP